MHDPPGHDGGDDARLLPVGRRIDDDQVCALAAFDLAAIAFNDHMSHTVDASSRAQRLLAQMAQRSGATHEGFLAVVERTKRRADEVPASIERLAAAANANGVPLLSHDDASPEQRRWFRRANTDFTQR